MLGGALVLLAVIGSPRSGGRASNCGFSVTDQVSAALLSLSMKRDHAMLTVHHLRRSQSERIVWLCEELGIPYELKTYDRDPVTFLAPAEYKALHPMGTAPVIRDGDLVLGESGAIVQYLLAKHGSEQLQPVLANPAYPDYLFWFHFANATLQPAMGRNMLMHRLALPNDNPMTQAQRARLELVLGHFEARVRDTEWLAGTTFTIADMMNVFSLTTMRLFYPLDLAPYAHIRAYLQRIGARSAYCRAMEKGDPGFAPMLA